MTQSWPVRRFRKAFWYERLAVLVALVNLVLVFFNLSYIPLRDFYLREFPWLVRRYDPLKGIEPHRDTARYLEAVSQLERQLAQSGLQGQQVEPMLTELRDRSVALVDENPFQIANKTGTLEKIKNRMRERLGEESSKEAFREFWSRAYLEQAGWPQALDYFDSEIRPLMTTNYYRGIGENGEFIDAFWRIDLFFIAFFAAEFLARTFYLHRRYRDTSWLDTMIWRWYDIFLLLPFWRWLRVIPVAIRLHQVGWLNLERVRAQANHSIAASLAAEVTDMVFVGIINQLKSTIRSGEIAKLFSQSRQYVEINDVNEVEAIAHRLVNLTVYKVYPQIQPDVEALLSHTIESALKQTTFYQSLRGFPAIAALPSEISQQLAAQLSQATYRALTHSLEDDKGARIFSDLTQHFGEAFRVELEDRETLQEIQSLLLAFLEEVKLTYLQHPTERDLDQTLVEVAQVYRVAQDATLNRAQHQPPGKLFPPGQTMR